MNTITENINEQKRKQYNKAKEDLIKALDSFGRLDNAQKQQLILEIVGMFTITQNT